MRRAACEDLGELVEISREGGAIEAAMRNMEKFAGTPRYYEVARAVRWAEWKAGQELREAEREQGKRHDLTSSQPGNKSAGFLTLLGDHKLKKDTAYRWITMSYATREEVEEYMDTQADAGRPTRRQCNTVLVRLARSNCWIRDKVVISGYRH